MRNVVLLALRLLTLAVAMGVVISSAQIAPGAHADSIECPVQDGWHRLSGPEDPSQERGAPGWGRAYAIVESRIPSGRLYSGGFNGLYHSDDCGIIWQRHQSSTAPTNTERSFFALAIGLDGRVFASVSPTFPGPLYRSDGGGENWTPVSISGGVVPARQGGLVSAPSGRLYVQMTSSPTVMNGEAFAYSDDGGESWVLTSRSIGYPSFSIDLDDPSTIYAVPWPVRHSSPYWLVRSTDSGAAYQNWSTVDEVPGAIMNSVDGSRFWLASYGQHLWQSRDRGQSWQILDTMPFTNPKQLAVSPQDPRILYAVSGDGYIWVYREPDTTP